MSIQDICKTYGIRDYTINDDGSIDVASSVYINGWDLYEIPLNFNKVDGLFYCDSNKLTSLKGCPNWVGDDFTCDNNELNYFVNCWVILFSHHQLKMLHRIGDFLL